MCIKFGNAIQWGTFLCPGVIKILNQACLWAWGYPPPPPPCACSPSPQVSWCIWELLDAWEFWGYHKHPCQILLLNMYLVKKIGSQNFELARGKDVAITIYCLQYSIWWLETCLYHSFSFIFICACSIISFYEAIYTKFIGVHYVCECKIRSRM